MKIIDQVKKEQEKVLKDQFSLPGEITKTKVVEFLIRKGYWQYKRETKQVVVS